MADDTNVSSFLRMFYHLTLSQSIDVHPKFFGPRLHSVIEASVKAKVEGLCLGQRGFCVCVTRLREVGQGDIRRDGTGLASFHVLYDCIVFRPFRGQILEGTVRTVTFSGFIVEAGPAQIFVSNHCIPDTFTFSADNEGTFESAEKETRIVAGSDVRVRIMSVRMGYDEIMCVGAFNERGLGLCGP